MVEQVALFILKQEHLGDFSKGLAIHQDEAVALDVHGRAEGWDSDVEARIEYRLSRHVEIDHALEGAKHRDNSIQRGDKIYQLTDIDIMQAEVEAYVALVVSGCVVNHYRLHLRTQPNHAQVL